VDVATRGHAPIDQLLPREIFEPPHFGVRQVGALAKVAQPSFEFGLLRVSITSRLR
jgi:hypothetical protein